MKAIIIGAGRGRRLMPTTADTPKCFAEVQGRRILDWILEAFAGAGITDVCFIGGYQIDKVRADYPSFEFRHNRDWETNNILASLMHAEDVMDAPFVCCYSDILFTTDVVARLMRAPNSISLAVDTQWLDRYTLRTQHPTDDAEKVTVKDGTINRIHRSIDSDSAFGEYIGVAKFDAAGGATLIEQYHRAREAHSGKPFREAEVFAKAYLIHLFQEMIERGVELSYVETKGGYMEIDTQEDFELAQTQWRGRV